MKYVAICHDDNDAVLASCTFDSREKLEAKVETLFDHIVGTEYISVYTTEEEREDGSFVLNYLTAIDKFNIK